MPPRKFHLAHKKAKAAECEATGAKLREFAATVARIQEVGRRQWKKEAGYHQQGRVENTFFRYKRVLGGRLRARDPAAQTAEVRLGCNVLNRMFELGAAKSVAIGR